MEERIGFGKRLGAYLIDWVVIMIGGTVAGSVLGGVLGAGAGAAAGAGAGAGGELTAEEAELALAAGGALGGLLGALAGMMIGIGVMAIVWIIWEGATGAALGKLLLKIRIKSDDGSRGSPGRLITRAAVKFSGSLLSFLGAVTGIGILGTLGMLAGVVIFFGCFLVLGQSKQALHDIIAKTAVYPN